jgi:hypothetical protein
MTYHPEVFNLLATETCFWRRQGEKENLLFQGFPILAFLDIGDLNFAKITPRQAPRLQNKTKQSSPLL